MRPDQINEMICPCNDDGDGDGDDDGDGNASELAVWLPAELCVGALTP